MNTTKNETTTWVAFPAYSGIITEHEETPDGILTGRTRTTYPQNYRVNDSTFYTFGEAKAYADLYADATGIRPDVENIGPDPRREAWVARFGTD